jgi:PadR family transcriptional regulator
MLGTINEMEQLILLALVRLGDEAYGVTVRDEIEATAGRAVSIAAVYAALDRMERRRWVKAWYSDPSPARGGRAKKHFRITRRGVAAVRAAREAMDRMWRGVDLELDLPS